MKDHQCDPQNLSKRVAGIRSDLGANKDPNRKVKFVPKANKCEMAAAAIVSQACVSYVDSIHDLGHCNNPVHCCTQRIPDQEVARAGCTNLLLCQHPNDGLRDLNQFLSIKASDPGHTDAHILCPHLPHAPCSPQTNGMVQIACLLWSKFCTDEVTPVHDSKFVLWYDH